MIAAGRPYPSRAARLGAVLMVAAASIVGIAPEARAFVPGDIPANSWVRLTVPAPQPSVRGWNQGVYEGAHGTLLFFDGYSDALHPWTIYSNAIWSYSMASNAFTLRTLSPWHGGDLVSDWYLVSPCNYPCETSHPFDRHPYGGLVYDSRHNAAILFGGVNARSGRNGFKDTWSLDLSNWTWTERTPAVGPSEREEQVMVYAPNVDATILVYGDKCNYRLCTDIWWYSAGNNQWTQKNTPGQILPAPRKTQSMVYDEANGKVILFGGDADTAFVNDTWIYDPPTNSWSKVTSPTSPSPRIAAGFAYDNIHQVALLFGGATKTNPVNDTWIYSPSLRRWTQLFPANSPPSLDRLAWRLAFDKSGVFLLYNDSGELWAFRYATSSDASAPSSVRDLRIR